MARRLLLGMGSLYRLYRRRIILSLALICLVSIPMLSYVAYALTHGYSTLESLAGVRESQTIKSVIRTARGDFERASFLFAPFSWIPLDRVDTVRRATLGGLALTRALDAVSQTFSDSLVDSGALIQKDIQDPLSYRAAPRDISPLASLGIENPTDWIVENKKSLEGVRDELILAGGLYSGVNPTGERTIRMQKT